MNEIKGFKVFNPDWTCRSKLYTCPGTFEEDVTPDVCHKGMHFCERLSDCFDYYGSADENYHVAEVIAHGEVSRGDDKCCTNKLEIVREIPWSEVLQIVNTGKSCTGICNTGDRNTGGWNTGDRNTGDCNTGDYNTGNRNTGDYNTGNRNTGDYNTGNRNTGDWNTGNRNTGDRNTGDCNTGDYNTGDYNTGDRNTGDCNTGDYNTGNRNTGDYNTGDCNTGDYNTGNRNTGDRNTGDYNTGDWNTSFGSAGCFNTEEQTITMFNKPSGWTLRDWLNSEARYYLNHIPKNVVEWVYSSDMTDEEKAAHPKHKTTGGYLKVLNETECAQVWWDGVSENVKNTIKSLPNFDAEVFKQCTGIDV